MIKLVMMPPQDALRKRWAQRLEQELPQYQVNVPQSDDEARRELVDADRDADNIPKRRFELLIDNARRFAADEPLLNVANKAAWY